MHFIFKYHFVFTWLVLLFLNFQFQELCPPCPADAFSPFPPNVTAVSNKRTRHELYQNIDAEYYGYKDDEDGLLAKLEANAEKQAVAEALQEWKEAQRMNGEDPDSKLRSMGSSILSVDGKVKGPRDDSFVSHVAVPDRADIEKLLVEARKQELMRRYMSNE